MELDALNSSGQRDPQESRCVHSAIPHGHFGHLQLRFDKPCPSVPHQGDETNKNSMRVEICLLQKLDKRVQKRVQLHSVYVNNFLETKNEFRSGGRTKEMTKMESAVIVKYSP